MKDGMYKSLDGGRKLPLVEDFYSVQGEGYHTGKSAYFIRLGGCDVGCHWCDAKMTWNPANFPPVEVGQIISRALECEARAIVITGGEPTLYPLGYLTAGLMEEGLKIFLETSGTNLLQGEVDWICLSPKRQQPPLAEMAASANELKVIIENEEDLQWAEICAAQVSDECLLYLQPEWSRYEKVIGMIVEYVKRNPRWNVSLQSHKFMHIP